MSKFALHIQKFNRSEINGLNMHVQRKTENHSNKDIDISKSHLNYDFVDGIENGHYLKEIDKRIEQGYLGKKKIRSDAALVASAVITSDKKFFDGLTEEQEREFFKTAYEHFAEKYGRENIISAKVHKDETTPHMHLLVVPLTKDGRLTGKELFDRNALLALQADIPKKLKQRGFNIERGESSDKKHIDTAEYKKIRDENQITVHINPNDLEPKKIGEKTKYLMTTEYFETNEQIAKRLTEKYVKPLTEELSDLKTQVALNDVQEKRIKHSKQLEQSREDEFLKIYHSAKKFGSAYVNDVIEKVKTFVSGLNAKQENELNAQEQIRQQSLAEKQKNNLSRLYGGSDDLHKILDWGKAPFNFEENGKPSYYVMAQSLKTNEKIVLWGEHLAETKFKYEEIVHVKGDKIERAEKIQVKQSKGMGI